jgi:hypothetical protein
MDVLSQLPRQIVASGDEVLRFHCVARRTKGDGMWPSAPASWPASESRHHCHRLFFCQQRLYPSPSSHNTFCPAWIRLYTTALCCSPSLPFSGPTWTLF